MPTAKKIFNYDLFLGQRINVLRKSVPDRKINQWDIAHLMGTNQSTVGQMLRGITPISHGLISSVAILLGVKPIEIDPFYEHPQRWGNNRIDFIPSPYLYVMFNSAIGWSKVGITNAPTTRQKALTSSTSTPGKWELVKCWELGMNSKEQEQVILNTLIDEGWTVDGELIEIRPDSLIPIVQRLIGDAPEIIVS